MPDPTKAASMDGHNTGNLGTYVVGRLYQKQISESQIKDQDLRTSSRSNRSAL